MADQLAPQFLPFYGHGLVRTPYLAALAQEGVVFDAAYCNSPLCGPARYVLMTGELPTKIAAWDNASEWSSEVPTIAHHLHALGYRTGLSGKMHFVGADQQHGFQDRLTTDVYPSDFTWHPLWEDPTRKLDWYHNMDVVTKAGPCIRASNIDFDDEVTFEAKRYIYERARDGEGQPYFLTVSYIQPHDPYVARPEHWELYRSDDIDLPVTAKGAIDLDAHSKRLLHAIGASETEPSEAQIRAARRAYYASTTCVDQHIGSLLQALKEVGEADNTVFVFTSDHGDMLGERGLWFKMSFLEHSARVPLLFHAPRHFAPRRVSEGVSHVDVLPTLLDIASDGKYDGYPTDISGRSLLAHLSGDDGHDEVIGEYCAEGTDKPVFMIRRGAMKFIASQGDPPQLYDLNADPHEHHNLANQADHSALLDELLRESRARWDFNDLRETVINSQRRRQFVAPILLEQGVTWDYQPLRNATTSYIRNHQPIYEIEQKLRYPKV